MSTVKNDKDLQTGVARRMRVSADTARAMTESQFASTNNAKRIKGAIFVSILLLGMTLALIMIVAVITWAIIAGSPRFDWALLTNAPSTLNPSTTGYRTAILGTIYVIGGVIVLIVPLGIGAAIYLEQFANRELWINRTIDVNIQNLAGVPSIVFGILGLAFIVRGPLSLGFVAAAGSITLALLVLPTVILVAREAIRAVPSSIKDAALALGATPWQAVWRQILPAAFPGILTGVILAVARAIGEAAPLLLVGAVAFVTFNPSFLEGGYSTLPVMVYTYAARPQDEFHTAAAAGVVVILALLFVINATAIWLRGRFERTW